MADPRNMERKQQQKEDEHPSPQLKGGQVWVKNLIRDNIPKGHQVFVYYFVTGVSLDNQWVTGLMVNILCALGENRITSIHPNYQCYMGWFNTARLIDSSQLPFVNETKGVMDPEDPQPTDQG